LTWRSTIAYWLIALVLGAYYMAFERRPAPQSDVRVAREKVLDVFSDEVTAVTLHREGREVRCEKRDKRWQIVKPQGAKAPADLVAALVENLTDKQEAEEINATPNAEDLRSFGLGDSSPTIEIEVGAKRLAVKLGSRNPPQTAIYAQTSTSPRVLLVGVNVQYYADLLYEAGKTTDNAMASR
jgi:Domain of unknown function (DUF4340)